MMEMMDGVKFERGEGEEEVGTQYEATEVQPQSQPRKRVVRDDSSDDAPTSKRTKKKEGEPSKKEEPSKKGDEQVTTKQLVVSALHAGLPGRFLTTDEATKFRPSARGMTEAQIKKFLITRNRLLRAWQNDPRSKVTVAAIKEEVKATDLFQPSSVYRYLERSGYLNYGNCKETHAQAPLKKSVCVVGAGLSGLMAAQQLRRAGFDVTVLEGRDKVGGRCRTVALSNGKQVSLGPPNRHDIPQLLEEDADDASQATEQTEKLIGVDADLDQLSQLGKDDAGPIHTGDGLTVSQISQNTAEQQGEVPDWMKRACSQEEAVVDYLLKQCGGKETLKLSAGLIAFVSGTGEYFDLAEMKKEGEEDEDHKRRLAELIQLDSQGDGDIYQYSRIEGVPLADHLVPRLREFFEAAKGTVAEARTVDPMDAQAAYAATLNVNKALNAYAAWSYVVARTEQGNHAAIDDLNPKMLRDVGEGGRAMAHPWMTVCQHLQEGLNIRFDTAVSKIKYDESGVIVGSTTTGLRTQVEEDAYDYCVLTVPIGVLKRTHEEGGIRFEPPLPMTKRKAIERIGMGLNNVLVLEFSLPFWKKKVQEGRAATAQVREEDPSVYEPTDVARPEEAELRIQFSEMNFENDGEEFKDEVYRGVGVQTFFSASPPHVSFTLSGKAAAASESEPAKVVEAALDRLRSAFGEEQVPAPKTKHFSNWGKDKWSYGSAPYAGRDTTEDDFEEMAAPAGCGGRGPLFFAGDGTHLGTGSNIHGSLQAAAMSGLRASQQVADHYDDLVLAGKTKKPMATLKDRLSHLFTHGAAPLAPQKDEALVRKKPTPDQQMEAAAALPSFSSRNIAMKYAKREAVPMMQRNLFNAADAPTSDPLVDKRGYINKAAAAQQIKGQKGLQKLERMTELRWAEGKTKAARALADRQQELQQEKALKTLHVSKGAPAPAKRARGTQEPAPQGLTHKQDPAIPKAYKCYASTNAVDDVRPVWYYQGGVQNAPQSREFAGNFFRGTASKNLDRAKEAVDKYEEGLEKIVVHALLRHTDPAKAQRKDFKVKFYATTSFESVRNKLVAEILHKFKRAVMARTKVSFDPRRDAASLPKLDNHRVRTAVIKTVDAAVKDYMDPERPYIIRKFGYDPAVVHEKVESEAKEELLDMDDVPLSELEAKNEIAVAKPSSALPA
eukprot:TRINITY_DN7617_c0_g1_i2.p1 TRINITY_DN7617_c0_g1~~TRINITY_DN7617_c0_g1_i2.p1  ORF type:complete len:1173 (+),score=499.76 TRINITY_DN7617_c0_g1_i2:474-3992(+)